MFVNPTPIQIGVLLVLVFLLFQLNNNLNNKHNPNNNPNNRLNNNAKIEVDWIDKPYGFGYGDKNMTPKRRLQTLIKDYGPPTVIDATSGGVAVWDQSVLEDTPFERIEIRDEQIPHDSPQPHVDFLYSWYRVDIPHHLAQNLHLISKSITYDPLKKLMSSRCHDMKANIVTHWIVKHYANYQLTIDEAGGMYGPMIMEIFQDSTGMKALELLNEL